MRRVVVPVVLGLGLTALAGATGTAAPPVPVVAPGRLVPVAARGFAGGTPVTVQLVGSVTGHRLVHADRHGRVALGYPAPQAPGAYTVLLAGRSASTPAPAPARPVTTPPGRTGRSYLDAIVPLVASVRFRVVLPGSSGGHGVDGTGSGADGQGLGGDHGLASSGTDVRTPLLLGAALLLLGAVTTAAARRRAHP